MATLASLEELRLEVACCLDTHFNLDRRHSALGYCPLYYFEHAVVYETGQ